MRFSRTPLLLASVAGATALAACDNGAKQQLATLAHVDSVRVDSLSNVQKSLLEEVMTSTQFVNDINTELGKARALATKPQLQLASNAERNEVNEQRKEAVRRIALLVAKLDSVQTRLSATRKLVQNASHKDSALVAQIATYEKSIADLQASTERQRADLQKTIDQQTVQIASLHSRVDTLSQVRMALVDTVGQLTTEKNTAYYVIGTKDELIKEGVLVAEGQKRFLIAGSRAVSPARQLDSSKFTKIDRLATRTIPLPAGQYEILTRQDQSLVEAAAKKDNKLSGSITIDQPEQFWAPSRYLIIVRS